MCRKPEAIVERDYCDRWFHWSVEQKHYLGQVLTRNNRLSYIHKVKKLFIQIPNILILSMILLHLPFATKCLVHFSEREGEEKNDMIIKRPTTRTLQIKRIVRVSHCQLDYHLLMIKTIHRNSMKSSKNIHSIKSTKYVCDFKRTYNE